MYWPMVIIVMRPLKNKPGMHELKITPAHIRQAGYCPSGVRVFARRYNLDFGQFIRDGFITADKILETGDVMAEKIINTALEEWQRDNG